MSQITDWAAKQTQFQDRIDTAIEGINTRITALQAQAGGGPTAEDLAALDAVSARNEKQAVKLESIANPPIPAP